MTGQQLRLVNIGSQLLGLLAGAFATLNRLIAQMQQMFGLAFPDALGQFFKGPGDPLIIALLAADTRYRTGNPLHGALLAAMQFADVGVHALAVNVLKIDQQFVQRLGQDGRDSRIVSAILAIAEALSLEVVAEGIETEIQKRKLQELNCHRGQGYLMARPSPLNQLQLD